MNVVERLTEFAQHSCCGLKIGHNNISYTSVRSMNRFFSIYPIIEPYDKLVQAEYRVQYWNDLVYLVIDEDLQDVLRVGDFNSKDTQIQGVTGYDWINLYPDRWEYLKNIINYNYIEASSNAGGYRDLVYSRDPQMAQPSGI